MRPFRFLLTIATCVIAFFFLIFSGPWGGTIQDSPEPRGNFRTFLNWRTPSSLFSPSAIISLTDDNSTFFVARPAAFGPLLPVRSLSAELWIGGGFGDDHLGRGGSTGSEGELGCSDVPGWDGGNHQTSIIGSAKQVVHGHGRTAADQGSTSSKRRRSDSIDQLDFAEDTVSWPDVADGTDDHLHHPLLPSDGLKAHSSGAGVWKKPVHADIQSLQESAEIAGKIVLLSRGGCGFLEKVKWVQRRGGTALIVGDNIRGEPLVTMYARGDISNITIPSLFTSHTTAHLLSSLITSGHMVNHAALEEVQRVGLATGDGADALRNGLQKSVAIAGNLHAKTSEVAAGPTKTPYALKNDQNNRIPSTSVDSDHRNGKGSLGWLSVFFGRRHRSSADSKSHVGWIQEEFEASWQIEYDKATMTTETTVSKSSVHESNGDGFVIGVQDWRDPDLVAEQKEQLLASTPSSTPERSPSSLPQRGQTPSIDRFEGGSITPGSGEYVKALEQGLPSSQSGTSLAPESANQGFADGRSKESGRWFGRLFRDSAEHRMDDLTSQETGSASDSTDARQALAHDYPSSSSVDTDDAPHEGLWVTLTPSSASSSPFFDTLLVLVVSPLVTLTVVYTLLLLRSRIRRRRWRAPKSVVERLPVRTYQTMPSTTDSSSTTSAISSPINATTPLLPSATRPITTRARPRSRTVSEIPLQQGSSLQSDSMASPSPEQIEEKRAAGLAEWRRRYGGKQRECVVCLEEYVDGVSRVMSLPCGHEFHAECITPWLTTRRRTCPICKGDVVRSLACSTISSSSPINHDIHDDDAEMDYGVLNQSADDIQEQAVLARNDDPSAARPVSREDEAFEDLERGLVPDRTR